MGIQTATRIVAAPRKISGNLAKGEPNSAINVPAPTGGVVSGQSYLVGSMFGVSAVTAAAGVQIAQWLVGAYTLTKNPAEAWTAGQHIYWDSANARCTTTSTGGNTKIGVAVAAAANPSSAGNVRLNGVF
jgi:predicted RecA/RadA family phage recombinase